MCGIFAYLNHLTPKSRKEILDILVAGLKRLEYRGYDSAGLGVDGSSQGTKTLLVKSTGKVKVLEEKILELIADIGTDSAQMIATCDSFSPWFWEQSEHKVMTV